MATTQRKPNLAEGGKHVFDALTGRLDDHDGRLTGHDAHLSGHDDHLKLHEAALGDHDGRIAALEKASGDGGGTGDSVSGS